MNRRMFLRRAGGAVLVLGAAQVILPGANAGTADQPRRLAFVNTHTGDTFNDAYWENGAYVPGAVEAIKHVMRDHRNNTTHDIDPHLFEQLHGLNGIIGASQPYQIISGYRSPQTNAMLHANSDGVAAHSLHMEGHRHPRRGCRSQPPARRSAFNECRRRGLLPVFGLRPLRHWPRPALVVTAPGSPRSTRSARRHHGTTPARRAAPRARAQAHPNWSAARSHVTGSC